MLELTERMTRRIVAAGRTAGYYVGTPEAAQDQAEEWGGRYLVTAVNQYMVSGGRSFLSQVRGGRGGGRLLRVLRRPPWRTCT